MGKHSSIDRTTRKYQGRGVTRTRKHIKVSDGYRVRYFPLMPVFHNLYRVVSIAGTRDHVIHSVK